MLILNDLFKKIIVILGVCFICSTLLHLRFENKTVSKLEEIRAWVIAYLDIGLQNKKYHNKWNVHEKRLAHLSVSHWQKVDLQRIITQEWNMNKVGGLIDAKVQEDYFNYWLTHNHYARDLRDQINAHKKAKKRQKKRRRNRNNKNSLFQKQDEFKALHIKPPFTSLIHQKVYEELRLHPPQHPAQIIAVREVHQQHIKDLQLTAYWVTPCSSLCGPQATCAQSCQDRITQWKGILPKGAMLLDAYQSIHHNKTLNRDEIKDLDAVRFLGRVALPHMGEIQVIFWSKTQKLLALTQKSEVDESHILYLFKATEQGLNLVAHLQLGRLGYNVSQLKELIEFKDLDDDGRVELIAPDPRFTLLLPQAINVSMVYKITKKGLVVKPQLIQGNIPELTELRTWLLQSTQDKRPLNEFFAELLTFCLQDKCHVANEILYLAYPQDKNIQAYWVQLKSYL